MGTIASTHVLGDSLGFFWAGEALTTPIAVAHIFPLRQPLRPTFATRTFEFAFYPLMVNPIEFSDGDSLQKSTGFVRAPMNQTTENRCRFGNTHRNTALLVVARPYDVGQPSKKRYVGFFSPNYTKSGLLSVHYVSCFLVQQNGMSVVVVISSSSDRPSNITRNIILNLGFICANSYDNQTGFNLGFEFDC